MEKIKKIQKSGKAKPMFNELLESAKDVKLAKKRNNCTFDDIKVLERFISKHGEDVEAMKKDVRLNIFMWTENDIRKKLKAFQQKKDGKKVGGYDL